MGMTKELMLEMQARQDIAENIAVEAKVLSRCEWHRYAYQGDWDYTAAYMLGNRKYSHGELPGTFHSRREMTDAIKDAVDNAPLDCLHCEKLRHED